MTFKNIKCTLGKYEVNYEGIIRNTKTKRIVKPYCTGKYLCISCIIRGKKKTLKVHILTAKTHCERPKPYKLYYVVNHLDLNKHNNHKDNLE